MSAIHVRIKESTKKTAQKILDKVGLDMSTAIKLYLHQIILTKGVPFRIVTENGFTPEEEAELLQTTKDAERGMNVSKIMSTKDALAYLKKL